MPAERYCESVAVPPARAKSKSLVASSMASGGSCETEVGFAGACGAAEGGVVACGRPIVCIVCGVIEWVVVLVILSVKDGVYKNKFRKTIPSLQLLPLSCCHTNSHTR